MSEATKMEETSAARMQISVCKQANKQTNERTNKRTISCLQQQDERVKVAPVSQNN